MAVSSPGTNRLSWTDEIGLLPLFVTLILPIVIGILVILKCVYNHCCLRKASTKSYTVKPSLKSWKGSGSDEEQNVSQPQHHSIPPTTEPSTSGTAATTSIPASIPSSSSTAPATQPPPPAAEDDRPIPPRRTSSGQWRRSVLTPAQQNSTNDTPNFSGDSQDSRGYTRISVREPLSSIRDQAGRRNGDPHYATVSDDSEEMYAAIEDGDGNYMRIPGDERHWQAERREANSPLPPVPPISPVAPDPSPTPIPDPVPILPPIYAQVTKVKKTKAPLTTTLSSASTSSQVQPLPDPPPPPPQPSTSKKRSHTSVILDPDKVSFSGEPLPRRWSKADINYSDFEVIREPPFPSTKQELDEDNYNIVPEFRTTSRIPRTRPITMDCPLVSSRTLPHSSTIMNNELTTNHPYAEITKSPPVPPLPLPPVSRTDHDGYTELAKRNSFTSQDSKNPYSKIEKRSGSHSPPSETTGYYQEIGEGKVKKKDNLYQKIRRKGPPVPKEMDESDDDEEEEDQFYEKVKSKAPPPPPPPPPGDLPDHSNPSALKHGYEKLKSGTSGGVVVAKVTTTTTSLTPPEPPPHTQPSDEDEDSGSMYEQVKFTPYERLTDEDLEDEGGEEGSEDNLYEHISCYQKSESKPKSRSGGAGPSSVDMDNTTSSTVGVDVNNLYARVDVTKKKKHTVPSVSS